MKRFLLLSAALAVVLLAACGVETRQEQVLSSLGHYEFHHFYSSGGFQDYTDYAVYTFSDADLTDNPYFAPLTQEDQETVAAFLDNFENWIEIIRDSDPRNEVVLHYDFDRSILDAGDSFYIFEDADYPEFGCYDVWLFDAQTSVLYYFHNNI